MKKLPFLVASILGATLALAASLPASVPPGAVAGLYARNLAIKKAYFVDFQAELAREKLTWDDLIALFGGKEEKPAATAELKRVLPLFSLDAIGQEGLFVVYPDGSLLALARPSAAARTQVLASLKKVLGKTQAFHGWQVKEVSKPEDSLKVLAGYRDDTLLLYGHPRKRAGIAGGFFSAKAKKGLRLPLSGDLVFFADARPLAPMIESLAQMGKGRGQGRGLPPRLLKILKTPQSYAFAVSLERDGIHSQSRLAFNPKGDPELAGLFLHRCNPWPLAALPRGASAVSYCFPLDKFGAYISKLASEFGQDGFDLDLTAFGDHLALVSFAPEATAAKAPTQSLFGDALLFVEARDDLTAETTVLSWLQLLAASNSPQGEGGFQVERYRVGRYKGKKITVGLGQPVYLFNLGDRLALATSERAAKALAGPRLGDDPGFQKHRGRYPKDAVMLGYGDMRRTLEGTAQSLLTTTPLAVGKTTSPKEAMELVQRIANFIRYAAKKFGASVSYIRVEGSTTVSESFTEVRW